MGNGGVDTGIIEYHERGCSGRSQLLCRVQHGGSSWHHLASRAAPTLRRAGWSKDLDS